MSELNNGNILFLDDDKFLTGIYEEKFTKVGCAIKATHSVDEAIRILRGGFIPDIVIYDLEIKVKDGFVFMQMLKDQQLARGAYFIALTNHSGAEDKQRAMELGTNAYIIKAEMIPDEVVKMTLDALAKRNSPAA